MCFRVQLSILFESYKNVFIAESNFAFHLLLAESHRNLCKPNPCGSHGICRLIGDDPSCSCQSGFIGQPPNCRPECVTSSECHQQEACINQKCRNPCEGTCGLGAECRVFNHNPICTCPKGFSGDPFEQCIPRRKNRFSKFFPVSKAVFF